MHLIQMITKQSNRFLTKWKTKTIKEEFKMKDIYTKELNKLAIGLIKRGIPFKFNTYFNGGQIDWGTCDAICHDGSYGKFDGLLEIMGDLVDETKTGDTVEGWLTAEEILNRIDAKRET
jgi:hypothetical protein